MEKLPEQKPEKHSLKISFPAKEKNMYLKMKETIEKRFAIDTSHESGWGEGPKVKFDDESGTIDFGYPKEIIKALFPEVFCPKAPPIWTNFFKEESYQQREDPIEVTSFWSKNEHEELKKKVKKWDGKYKAAMLEKKRSSEQFSFTGGEKLDKKLFEQMFSHPSINGIVIGELDHQSVYPKKLLIDNLEFFKAQGVDTIFLEAFFYKQHQKLLDEYFNSSDKLPPAELARYADFLDESYGMKGEKYSYYNLLIAIKEAGIRPVALDHVASIKSMNPPSHVNFDKIERQDARIITFNYYARKIMIKEGKGKHLSYVGGGHTLSKSDTYSGVQDLAENTIALGVALQGTQNNPTSGLQVDKKVTSKESDAILKLFYVYTKEEDSQQQQSAKLI